MHILYLTYSLTGPDQPGAQRPWQMKEFWLRRGHRLTVVVGSRNYLLREDEADDDRRKAITRSEEGDLTVYEVFATAGRRRSLRRRALNYASYAAMALIAGLRVRKVDLVYCRTPPMLINFTAWLLARWNRAAFVLEIGDLHPDEAVALGLMTSRPLIWAWEHWENFLRARADQIVAVVPGIKRMLVDKGFDPGKIVVATNAYDPPAELPGQEPTVPELEALLSADGNEFLVAYAGGMGPAMSLGCILDAAAILQERGVGARIALIGDGEQRPLLIERAGALGLANVTFVPLVPLGALQAFLPRCGALFHSVYAGEFHGYNLPNKVFTYMGAGRPLIFAGTGTIAEIVAAGSCGIVTPPEDAAAFADGVAALAADRALADEYGRNARRHVMEHFDRQRILGELDDCLAALVARRKGDRRV